MRSLFLIVVLAAAYTSARSLKMTTEAMACRGLLKPTQSEEAITAVLNKCIAAQPGLQAIIDGVKAGAAVANASLPSAGAAVANASLPSAGAAVVNASLPSAGAAVANASLTSTGAQVAKPHVIYKGGRKGDPAMLLKAAGKTAEVATLNKCLAKEKGYLVVASGGDSGFDVVKFKGEIKAKVAGTSSQAKTQLGLDKCPEADLVAFDVYKYMKCVKAYCITGAAPTNKA